MAMSMPLWNFQLYPEDDPITFLGGGEEEEYMTYSDEELGTPPTEIDLFGEVDLEDNPFDVEISEED